jgi:peptidyl-prolyl cis-trans isomerase C
MIRSAFISLSLFSILLCSASWAQQEVSKDALNASPAKSEEAGLVVARVLGQPITEKQILEVIDDLARQNKMSLEQQRQRNSLLFEDALDNLITVMAIKDQARQQNIIVDKALVDQQVQQLAKRYPSQEAFQKELSAQGVTESELRMSIEQSIALQQVIDQAVQNLPPSTDMEIEKFYNDNPDKFSVPERVHAAHILLRADRQNTEAQKAEISKRLEIIRADIEAKTITFAEAAAKYSQDTVTAAKGGDLGMVIRGRLPKSMEDAAFSIKPGTLSPVIETPIGYHIVQSIELKPAGKASLEESKSSIKQYLDQMAKQTATKKYIADLKTKATIESFMTPEEFAKRHPVQ